MPLHILAQVPGNLNALNTTGNTGQAGNTTYTYSVGEAVAFPLNSCAFTQGVIQPSYDCIVSIIEDFDQKYFSRFYPNPAEYLIYVETDFLDFAHYSVTSSEGKIIESGDFNYTPIPIGYLGTGIYYLQLTTSDKQIYKTVKIIKQ